MLKPKNEWKWFFDNDAQRLMLDLGQNGETYCIAIERKNLVPDAFCESDFSVDDATCFLTYSNATQDLALSEAQQQELVLNAVAARRFHKPFLPKSWFFHPQPASFSAPEGTIIELMTESSSGQFIIIENSGNASLCMLAQQDSFEFSQGKQMQFCDTIKVMNDRIFVVEQKAGFHTLALVG